MLILSNFTCDQGGMGMAMVDCTLCKDYISRILLKGGFMNDLRS